MNRRDITQISLREDILKEAEKQYRSRPEYLWKKFPEDAVLRRQDNRKWFAVFLTVSRDRLGLDGNEKTDILNVKINPEMGSMLAGTPGFFPGWHMHKGNWLTILLDGMVPRETIFELLAASYELTGGKKKK